MILSLTLHIEYDTQSYGMQLMTFYAKFSFFPKLQILGDKELSAIYLYIPLV